MPIVLTLPDGATREVEPGTLARDVVASIGSRLLRDAIAVSIDGEVQDLMTPIRRGGAFTVITEKDPRSLAVLRHSGAHILATAVRRIRPDAKMCAHAPLDAAAFRWILPVVAKDRAARIVVGMISIAGRPRGSTRSRAPAEAIAPTGPSAGRPSVITGRSDREHAGRTSGQPRAQAAGPENGDRDHAEHEHRVRSGSDLGEL